MQRDASSIPIVLHPRLQVNPRLAPIAAEPRLSHYDVVIIGGAVTGSSIASFTTQNPDFDGTVLVVERDTSYETSSTAHTNSCIRQQFSNPLNVQISQFGAEFVRNFRGYMGDDPNVPELHFQSFGYMYLADDQSKAEALRASQKIQSKLGAHTVTMSPTEIGAAYPFLHVGDLVCGNHNLVDEGYFDSGTMFDWMRRKARRQGAEYVHNEVVDIEVVAERVHSVTLASGRRVGCGLVVNAAGPRAVEIAKMAGTRLPVEPRKRFTFVFDASQPLGQDLPLTIDPSGIHVRSDGESYMAGCAPETDLAVTYDDFAIDDNLFEERVWPVLAHRIPAFERLKVRTRWAGHYAFNRLDQNVVVGPHHEIPNLIFSVGFSGHGMQQAPAVGRGVSEIITYGEFRTLDLSALGYDRIVENDPFIETAII